MDEDITFEELMNYVNEVIEEERLKGSSYCYFNNYLPDEVVFDLRSSGYVVTRYISKDIDTLENKRITCVYLKPRRG